MLKNSEHRPGSYAELLAIAIPMMMSSGTQSIMHVIDRMFVTWLSQDALAAALPAGILYWSCLSLPFGIASYINTFVAQYDGAGKPERVAAAVWQGLYFSVVAGLLMSLMAPWSDAIFNFIGHAPEVARLEAIYFSWLCWGGVPAVMQTVLSAFFTGRGDTRTVLAVNIGCVAINAALDYSFIFGWGPIPAFGMAGAAMTDVIGSTLACAIFLVLIFRPRILKMYPIHTSWRLDRGLFLDLMKFGGPSGLQFFIDVAGFTAFMMIVGWSDPKDLAATNLAFNLNTLAFIPVVGLGIAVSTLVGQRIGEKRPDLAAESTWKGAIVGCGYMLAAAVIYVGLPHVLILPYSAYADPVAFGETQATVTILLRFVAIYSFFDAMAIIFASAIRGAGDTRFAMWFGFVTVWLGLVLPTYLTWLAWGPQLYLSWTYCAIYVVALGFGYCGRFMQGKWRHMNVIHRDDSVVNASIEPATSAKPVLVEG
ncbi:MAG TPA: MATE family efflux transporter [Planctomycetaceae bacterium]|nr:MATE family efflux transporter [Planctomycetaceae bacterium]